MTRLVAILLLLTAALANAGRPLPIKASSNNRYFTDQTNGPFLVQGMAAWHILVNESTNTAIDILDRLQTNGFNSLQTRLIDGGFQSYDDSGIDNTNPAPEDFYGDSPFTTGWHFGRLNTNYFIRKRDVINWAAERNFILFCAPLYLGYAGSDVQGFYDEVITNTLSDVTNYGRFIGSYFKECSNLVWMMNGDHTPPASAEDYIDALAAGILMEDTSKLITEHVSGSARTYAEGKSWLTLNAIYAARPWQEPELDWVKSPVLPMYLTETSYEYDGTSPSQWKMQSHPYWAIIQGALGGQIMGNRYFCEGRGGWTTNYITAASQKQPFVSQFFTNKAWWKMQPDTNDHVTTGASKGNFNSATTYNPAAGTSDKSFMVSYAADDSVSIEVYMTNIVNSTGMVSCYWYDPRNGSNHLIGLYTNTGSRSFSAPTDEGWVLHITGDAQDEEPPAATTNYYRAYMSGKIEMSGKAVLQ